MLSFVEVAEEIELVVRVAHHYTCGHQALADCDRSVLVDTGAGLYG